MKARAPLKIAARIAAQMITGTAIPAHYSVQLDFNPRQLLPTA